MLSEVWRDVVSILGFLLTIAGLTYAIWQIYRTKSAARAATEAALEASEESRKLTTRFSGANAHRYVNEVQYFANNSEWGKASLRLADIADLLAFLTDADECPRSLVRELRAWATTFDGYSAGRKPRFSK